MGVKTPELLDVLGVPYEIMEGEGVETVLDRLLARIEAGAVPGALLVRAGVIT
jgi:hypothetical protein